MSAGGAVPVPAPAKRAHLRLLILLFETSQLMRIEPQSVDHLVRRLATHAAAQLLQVVSHPLPLLRRKWGLAPSCPLPPRFRFAAERNELALGAPPLCWRACACRNVPANMRMQECAGNNVFACMCRQECSASVCKQLSADSGMHAQVRR